MKANLKEEDQAAHQKQMESVVEWHLGDKGVTNFTIHLDAKPDCVAASMGTYPPPCAVTRSARCMPRGKHSFLGCASTFLTQSLLHG